MQVASRLQIQRGVRRALALLISTLVGGCFYSGDLNDRPSAEIARLSSGLPIFALSRHQEIVRRMCLYRGVQPLLFDYTRYPAAEVGQVAVTEMQNRGLVQGGDRVILTRGDLLGVGGSTTTLKIIEV